MALLSRREVVKYIAALPVISTLGYCSGNPADPPCPYKYRWNLLLHGLFIVQQPSPLDANLIRLILPHVDTGAHYHSYLCNGTPLNRGGYSLYCSRCGPLGKPDPDSSVSLAINARVLNENSGLAGPGHCWIDLPAPSRIVPLRVRTVQACKVQFPGSLPINGGRKPTKLPAITLFSYDLSQYSPVLSNLPGNPSSQYNLILRSEPPTAPSDLGVDALEAARQCMNVSKAEFDMYSEECCPPPAMTQSDLGVSSTDETSLQEINGYSCASFKSIQPRACMTFFTS